MIAVDLPDPADRTRAEPGVPPEGSRTILVVEDEDPVRDLVCRLLRCAGYQVLEARDGTDALRVARACRGPIHLLLTDVVLPRMNGGQLAQFLRLQRPEMRVLYVSGFSNEILHQLPGCLDLPGVLSKPFDPHTLRSAVERALGAAEQR